VAAGSQIIVCGKRFDVDHRVVTFEDEQGFSAYVPHRTDDISQIYASHPAPGLARRAMRYRHRRLLGQSTRLSDLKQLVRQVTIHLDGCASAAACFDVLHNQRGLSVHFMIDNDGTIYQTLDLLHCAFHAAGVNEVAIGIELQNRGDAARFPNFYDGERQAATCWVHGVQFLSYVFTEAQYEAVGRLSRALARILEIPPTSPRHGGDLVWTTIEQPRRFSGFLGHYHVSANKWDPGPFDFPRLFSSIGTRATFPLSRPRFDGAKPTRGESAPDQSLAYFENAELDVDAHFPVGPLGRSHLWHGGVHLRAREGAPVYAPTNGRIVAARDGAPCPVGSCNFVLLRHRLRLRDKPVEFFSLLYHLAPSERARLGADQEEGLARPPWLDAVRQDQRAWVALQRGDVTALDVAVEAGELLGRVGRAGPAGYRIPQIHFAVFSKEEIGAQVAPGYWRVLDSGDDGRLCRDMWLLRRIDRSRGGRRPDGKLSRRELRNFFQFSPRRIAVRTLVVRHRSEWTPGGWAEALAEAPDFAQLSPAQQRRLLVQQVEPTLWWTPALAEQVGLPKDGMIYSYQPIGFVVWLKKLQRRRAVVSRGIASATLWRGQMAPRHLTVDAEAADAMTDHEDFFAGDSGKQLELEDLVQGYPE
jgi:N-acetylmuramoyl-L-alanine amidase